MRDNIFPSFKAIRLGKAIYAKTLEINKDLSKFDKNAGMEKEDMPYVLHNLEEELNELYVLVSDILTEDSFELKKAYDTEYAHPRFKRDTPLDVILSYTYLMVTSISKHAYYDIIQDPIHLHYANALIAMNHVHFSKYVKV